jgi:hypothetical protein
MKLVPVHLERRRFQNQQSDAAFLTNVSASVGAVLKPAGPDKGVGERQRPHARESDEAGGEHPQLEAADAAAGHRRVDKRDRLQFPCIAIDTKLAAALDGQDDASFREILASNIEHLAEAIRTESSVTRWPMGRSSITSCENVVTYSRRSTRHRPKGTKWVTPAAHLRFSRLEQHRLADEISQIARLHPFHRPCAMSLNRAPTNTKT